MKTQEKINFLRMVEAIDYLKEHFKQQPSLEEISAVVQMSPFHFQKVFTAWAGVSPKKFVQYLSVEYAKKILRESKSSLLQTSYETGLSGSGRLHDLFMEIEGMTPGEYKHGGENLLIKYSYFESTFGKMLVASTGKGICYIGFSDDQEMGRLDLQKRFPKAKLQQEIDELQENAMSIFRQDWKEIKKIKLHLRGTDFQIKVWNSLLKIPLGQLSTYGEIAAAIDNPKACRAVGSAVGDNPITFLIPCHRVIQSTGQIGQYYWGSKRKTAILGWEAAQTSGI